MPVLQRHDQRLMAVWTDSPAFVEHLLGERAEWQHLDEVSPTEMDAAVNRLLDKPGWLATDISAAEWPWLIAAEKASRSQYDTLIDLSRTGSALPDRLLCVAGTGEGFHGFRGRPWSTAAGNIHLSTRLTAPVSCGGDLTIGFLAMAAVSVVEAIDSLPGMERRAGIKWVNDILVEGAKVCGILAHTESIGGRVTAGVIGIGLNAENTPEVQATPFVPRVASLRDLSPKPEHCGQSAAFRALIAALSRNYARLVDGGYDEVLDRYRERSLVIGHEVTVYAEEPESDPTVVARGRVTGLGRRLELLLENAAEPIDRGRLILDPLP